jgi:tRNA 2-thiouridine synthesizing protein A
MAEAGDIALTLDLRGLKCPLPVLRTQKAMATISAGATISVETTDPLASIDIPHFCAENRYTLVSQERTGSGHRFVIRKTATRRVLRLEDFTEADIQAIEKAQTPPEAAAFNDELGG